MAAYYSAMAVFYAAMAAYYTVMTTLYIVMTALYIVVTAFYIVMTAFYTAMAGLHSTEHSRKLCSPKVSSPVFLLTRTDPPTLDPPNDGHQKTAHPMKDKLAIPTLLKVDSTSATMLDPITTRKEHCRFSMEETERAVTTSTLAKHKCAPAPDKLVPLMMVPAILSLDHELVTLTMVPAILFLDHKLVTCTMVPAILFLDHKLVPITMVPAILDTHYAMLHARAVLDPVFDTVRNPAQLHVRALLEPVLDTVPTKPPCTPSPRSPPSRTSPASAASISRSTAASPTRRQRERGRRRKPGRKQGCARSYPNGSCPALRGP